MEVHQAAHNGMMIGFRITSERAGNTKFMPLVKEAVRKKGNIGLCCLQLEEELLDSLGTCLRENANTALCQKARGP
ncbi:MAG: hypothetical protein QXI38_03545 [Conexivisphaerales archaeon]